MAKTVSCFSFFKMPLSICNLTFLGPRYTKNILFAYSLYKASKVVLHSPIALQILMKQGPLFFFCLFVFSFWYLVQFCLFFYIILLNEFITFIVVQWSSKLQYMVPQDRSSFFGLIHLWIWCKGYRHSVYFFKFIWFLFFHYN